MEGTAVLAEGTRNKAVSEQKSSFFKSSFFTRLMSGIVLVALILIFLSAGGYPLWGGLLAVSLVGVFELYRVMDIHNKPLGFAGYLMTILYYIGILLRPDNGGLIIFILILSMVILLSVYVLTFPSYNASQTMTAFFAIVYVAVMLSYIYQCRNLHAGSYLVWLVFICSWGCDTCAYCAGVTLGKHKMAPVLSPKKSVEGAIGGVIGAVALGMIFGKVFASHMEIDAPVLACGVICLIGSLISMIGDLAASAIKRDHQVKDYGTLIPGHGGILDRFDSVIFTAPIIYYTALYFITNSFIWQ